MNPSPRLPAVRVTAHSIHSEWQGRATSVQDKENICTEVVAHSLISSDSRKTDPNQTDSRTKGSPMNSIASGARRETFLAEGGSQRPKITNGDLLAWL